MQGVRCKVRKAAILSKQHNAIGSLSNQLQKKSARTTASSAQHSAAQRSTAQHSQQIVQLVNCHALSSLIACCS